MSKRFTFPLQKALDWYRQSLSSEQASLQRIINEIHTLDVLKESLERRRYSEHEQLHRAGRIVGKDLRGLANYSALIRADLARLAAERARKEASLAEQRRRVVAQNRRVRVLEELEQRRKSDWLHGVRAEEETLAADVFLAAHTRRNREQNS